MEALRTSRTGAGAAGEGAARTACSTTVRRSMRLRVRSILSRP